jgi:hypothetical protein
VPPSPPLADEDSTASGISVKAPLQKLARALRLGGQSTRSRRSGAAWCVIVLLDDQHLDSPLVGNIESFFQTQSAICPLAAAVTGRVNQTLFARRHQVCRIANAVPGFPLLSIMSAAKVPHQMSLSATGRYSWELRVWYVRPGQQQLAGCWAGRIA